MPGQMAVPVNGLFVAGRNFSSEPVVNNMFNVIPYCVVMGQAGRWLV
jgi:hypothetical protein